MKGQLKETLVHTSNVKAAIKSIPFLYNILLPGIILFRRARAAFYQYARKPFRQYCSYLPNVVLEPMFVKVGANDGITGDPCSDLLLADPRWKGLLIEPVPYCFERLRSTFHDDRRFYLEQVAVGTPAGEATFYYVDSKARESVPNLPVWFDQLGSFDKSHIAKHLNGALVPFIVECKVKVCPLTDILGKHGIQEVHLLHIDTEGYDYEVLKTLNWEQRAPVAIFVEYRHLRDPKKTEMLQLLRQHGYSVRDCGGDYFALDRKAYKRLQRQAK